MDDVRGDIKFPNVVQNRVAIGHVELELAHLPDGTAAGLVLDAKQELAGRRIFDEEVQGPAAGDVCVAAGAK